MSDRDNNASNSVLQHVLQKQNKLAERLERMERLERPGNDIRAMAWSIGMLQMFPGLVGLWPGGVLGSGTTGNLYYTDLSGHGLDLTRNAGTVITYVEAVNRLVPHYFFNGSAYANHADANILDIVGTESGISTAIRGLTIGGWFYFARDATTETLMGKWASGTSLSNSYRLDKHTDDTVRLFISDTTPSNIGVAVGTLTQGAWHFCAGRYSPGSELKVWLNDNTASDGPYSIPASINNSPTEFAIGARNTASTVLDYFSGRASLCFLCAAAVPDVMLQSFYQYSRALFGV